MTQPSFISLRDTKQQQGPTLEFALSQMRRLTEAVRQGAMDRVLVQEYVLDFGDGVVLTVALVVSGQFKGHFEWILTGQTSRLYFTANEMWAYILGAKDGQFELPEEDPAAAPLVRS